MNTLQPVAGGRPIYFRRRPFPPFLVLCTVVAAALFVSACSSATEPELPADSAATAPAGAGDVQPEAAAPTSEAIATASPPLVIGGIGEAPSAVPSVARLNLNTATDAELLTVPGAGERMLREFKEYRPYVSIVQFRREIGKYVDEEVVAGFEDYLFVPISPDESDAETLMQIPGVDAGTAEHLATERPFLSNEAFLSALESHLTPEQVDAARLLLERP